MQWHKLIMYIFTYYHFSLSILHDNCLKKCTLKHLRQKFYIREIEKICKNLCSENEVLFDNYDIFIAYYKKNNTIDVKKLKNYYFKQNKVISLGYYLKTINKTGWNILRIHTFNNVEDIEQFKAAGLIEGYATINDIWDFYRNIQFTTFNNNNQDTIPQELDHWFINNRNWVQEKYKNKTNNGKIKDNQWDLIIGQQQFLENVLKGQNMAASQQHIKKLSQSQIQLINSNADLQNLLPALKLKHQGKFNNSHCSAIIAVTPDLSNLQTAHSTWSNQNTMLRIYKQQIFNLNNVLINNKIISMSSYPATIQSVDDFYINYQTKMVITETTNDINSTKLLEIGKNYKGLLTYIPIMISNMVGNNIKTYIKQFIKNNLFLYSNQWIIVDYKNFKPNKPLPYDNITAIIETVPGQYSIKDVTKQLSIGHWPSYNQPFLTDINKISGFNKQTWTNAPRALLFRLYGQYVKNNISLQKFMRYNNYKNDPNEMNNPMHAIMSRGDLVHDMNKKTAFGGIDTKQIDQQNIINNGYVYIKSGPTNDNLKTFDWDNYETIVKEKQVRFGLPKNYNFKWIKTGLLNMDKQLDEKKVK